MNIEVYGLNKVLKIAEKDVGCNLISIRDYYCGQDTLDKYACLDRRVARNHINQLTVYFDDIDPYRFYHGMEHISIKSKFEDGTREPRFFNAELANKIVMWVKKLWDKDHDVTIKVHCWAGRSRSQALAYWLNMYFNLILDRNIDAYHANNARNIHEKIHFNCEVLRVLSTEFG